MIAAALLCAVLAAPALEISIAPDQPVPYIYADEPVILQIKSNEDGQATGAIAITDGNGDTVSISLQAIPLRANGAHWQPIDGAPAAIGRFTVRVALTVGGSTVAKDLVYCRIKRPNNAARAPVRVTLNDPSPATLHALRGVPLREITVPITMPDVAGFVSSAVADGFQVTVALDAAAVSDMASLVQLAAKLGESVSAWRVSVPDLGVETLESLAAALRDAGARGQIEAVLTSGLTNVSAYLSTGLGRSAYKVFLPHGNDAPSEIGQLRAAFESAGYEGFRMQELFAAPDVKNDGSNHWLIARNLLDAQAEQGMSPEIDASIVFAKNAFGEPYTLISAMAHRLNGYACLEELPMAPRARAIVFRQCNAWVMVAWAMGQPVVQPIPVGTVADLALTDANDNPLPAPEAADGSIRLALTAAPVYLSGNGGSMLAAVARAAARKEAESFAKNKSFQKDLPAEFVELIKPIAAQGFNRVDRVTFFALLRMFPVLEQKWHDGSIILKPPWTASETGRWWMGVKPGFCAGSKKLSRMGLFRRSAWFRFMTGPS